MRRLIAPILLIVCGLCVPVWNAASATRVESTTADVEHQKMISADEQLIAGHGELPKAADLAASIELPSIPLVDVTNDSGPEWSWVIDVSAVLTMLLSLSGFGLLLYLRRRRVSGVLSAVAGTNALVGARAIWVP